MRIYICYLLLFFSIAVSCPARGETALSLADAIALARTNSVEAAMALGELKAAYWQYRAYRAELLPEISFSATIPAYHKQYSSYMNEDGEYSFVGTHYLQLNGQVTASQNIWLTGGKVSVISSLDFMRQLGADGYNRAMSVPVALTLEQPVFATNNIRWKRRIEPVRYREAQARFLSDSEDVAANAISLYFNLLLQKENLQIARQNLDNAEKLHEVAVEKRAMGQISRNDLLQMELNMLDARSSLTDAVSEYRNAMFSLRTFLDIDDSQEISAEMPPSLPQCEVTFDEAYAIALERNRLALSLRRRQLEAEYDVAKAKGDMRSIRLFAQVGFTGTSHDIAHAYSPLKDNQLVEIGFEIPILDWGKRRGNVKVAESRKSVTESTLRKEAREFSQQMYLLVERYTNQRRQIEIASRADTIATRRYTANVETYLTGRISTLDLNDSRSQKDRARRDYINQLYLGWLYYYQLRSLTLWDFATGTPIDSDFDALLR